MAKAKGISYFHVTNSASISIHSPVGEPKTLDPETDLLMMPVGCIC